MGKQSAFYSDKENTPLSLSHQTQPHFVHIKRTNKKFQHEVFD